MSMNIDHTDHQLYFDGCLVAEGFWYIEAYATLTNAKPVCVAITRKAPGNRRFYVCRVHVDLSVNIHSSHDTRGSAMIQMAEIMTQWARR